MTVLSTSHPPVQSPSVHISIVVYNTWEDAVACVKSILAQQYAGELAISIWDNGAWSAQRHDMESLGVRINGSGRNEGFGHGHNKNVLPSTADMILILNPDTILPPDFLRRVQSVHAGDAMTVVAPQLVGPSGRIEISARVLPSVRSELVRALGLDWLTGGTVLTSWDHRGEREVPQPPGAALYMPHELFARVGGFDERFPLYFEDVDLCKRLWDEGARIVFSDRARLVHMREGTAKRFRAKSIFWIEFSRRIYVHKHFPFMARIATLMAGVAGVSLRAGLFGVAAMMSRKADSKSRAKGYALALCGALYGNEGFWRRHML